MSQSPSYGLLRLQSKDARSAIVQKLSSDFNLTAIIAEAYYSQFALYFQEHANISLSSGEIAYEAVAADEPAGRHIRLTRKITVRLRLLDFNISQAGSTDVMAALLPFGGNVVLEAGSSDKVVVTINDDLTVGARGITYLSGTLYGVIG